MLKLSFAKLKHVAQFSVPQANAWDLAPVIQTGLRPQAVWAHLGLGQVCSYYKDCNSLNTHPVLLIEFCCFIVHFDGCLVLPQEKPAKGLQCLCFSCVQTLLCSHYHLCQWEMILSAASPDICRRSLQSQHCSLSGPRSSILALLGMQGMNAQALQPAFVSKERDRRPNTISRDRKGSVGQVCPAQVSTCSSGPWNQYHLSAWSPKKKKTQQQPGR